MAVIIGMSHMKLQVAVCAFVFILMDYDSLPSILLPGNYEGQIVNVVTASLTLWVVAMKHFRIAMKHLRMRIPRPERV